MKRAVQIALGAVLVGATVLGGAGMASAAAPGPGSDGTRVTVPDETPDNTIYGDVPGGTRVTDGT